MYSLTDLASYVDLVDVPSKQWASQRPANSALRQADRLSLDERSVSRDFVPTSRNWVTFERSRWAAYRLSVRDHDTLLGAITNIVHRVADKALTGDLEEGDRRSISRSIHKYLTGPNQGGKARERDCRRNEERRSARAAEGRDRATYISATSGRAAVALDLRARGLTARQVAAELHCSLRTVRRYFAAAATAKPAETEAPVGSGGTRQGVTSVARLRVTPVYARGEGRVAMAQPSLGSLRHLRQRSRARHEKSAASSSENLQRLGGVREALVQRWHDLPVVPLGSGGSGLRRIDGILGYVVAAALERSRAQARQPQGRSP